MILRPNFISFPPSLDHARGFNLYIPDENPSVRQFLICGELWGGG